MFERERTWERIDNGFSSGKCVVTLGTGPRSDIFWRDVKLLESHSYAVIGRQMFTLVLVNAMTMSS